MDAADLAWLQTPEGRAAAEEAAGLLERSGELVALRQLGRRLDAVQARAAVALAAGRQAARGKIEDAERLFCDREAAEQASPDLVAVHIAAHPEDQFFEAQGVLVEQGPLDFLGDQGLERQG